MIVSKNPYTGETIEEHHEFTSEEINAALERAETAFLEWKQTSFEERADLMRKVAAELVENKDEYAATITKEMGKPISQAVAEIEKCAWACHYYADNAKEHLEKLEIKTDATSSYVNYEPLGVILAIMPWNYPFWQVFRFAAPALMAGNVGVLKHASNVMLSANNIQKVFERAGFPANCFQNLVVGSDKIENIIDDARIKAVTLTGSTGAGKAVSSAAGRNIKKTVLELGGSNALVVFDDANLKKTVEVCVQARFQNTGQSCIAGKRLLLHENIAEEFLKQFEEKVEALKAGDPMEEDTFIGVQAREDLAEELDRQVQESVNQGAKLLLGGVRKRAFYEPTILTDVTSEMPVFKEETFGPAIGVTTFESEEEAVNLINGTEFGLGASLFTEDFEKAQRLIPQIQDGAVFINELVKSDPRLPFGGTKQSGYGRELSFFGIREFVNVQTIYFKKF